MFWFITRKKHLARLDGIANTLQAVMRVTDKKTERIAKLRQEISYWKFEAEVWRDLYVKELKKPLKPL